LHPIETTMGSGMLLFLPFSKRCAMERQASDR
jgi:hypothetical protein